jgi:hypothetical protein
VDGPAGHPVARLAAGRGRRPGERLTVSGFVVGGPVAEVHSRELGVEVAGWEDKFLRVIHDEVTPGLSGGAVTRPRTGEVCGVLKASQDYNAPRGGWMTPAAALPEVFSSIPFALKAPPRTERVNFSADQREKIAALLAETGLLVGDVFTLLLQGIDQRLGDRQDFASNVRYTSAPAFQARQLIRYCLDRDDQLAALEALTATVEILQPGQAASARFAEAVRSALGGDQGD